MLRDISWPLLGQEEGSDGRELPRATIAKMSPADGGPRAIAIDLRTQQGRKKFTSVYLII